jgi:glycosyltransferase involved in cell wall biosynthesis
VTVSDSQAPAAARIAFIGCAGVPNRYGGFEAFVEHCGPELARRVAAVTVTCDAALYDDRTSTYAGMTREFIDVRANGGASILHDLVAFLTVFRRASHIVVLGVSGGLWFPLFRLLCDVTGKRLLVNVDGVEWRRTKFGGAKRGLLRVLDALAQTFAHVVVYDNPALRRYLLQRALRKSVYIGYSGDHVLRLDGQRMEPATGLTICRIEPENNVDLLIDGALRSQLRRYTVVGNWQYSEYGRQLRDRHAGNPRLDLLDPIYDEQRLAALRESCSVYIHGHSVGGTNPSLVEMLFYDCEIVCFDVPFHHETAGDDARYFRDADELARLLDSPLAAVGDRAARRQAFSQARIAQAYIDALTG